MAGQMIWTRMVKDPLKSEKSAQKAGARALADQLARQEREAAALRANLRKRKDQARARENAGPGMQEPGIKPA